MSDSRKKTPDQSIETQPTAAEPVVPTEAVQAEAQAPTPEPQDLSLRDIKAAEGDQPTALAAIQAVQQTAAGQDEKESIDRLIAESDGFFGHPTTVAAGAFHALATRGVTQLTRAQGAAVIAAWLSAPAATDEDR